MPAAARSKRSEDGRWAHSAACFQIVAAHHVAMRRAQGTARASPSAAGDQDTGDQCEEKATPHGGHHEASLLEKDRRDNSQMSRRPATVVS
jgi:hypothetical protein